MKPDPIPTPPTPDSEAQAMVDYLMDEHAPATLEAMADHLDRMFDMDTRCYQGIEKLAKVFLKRSRLRLTTPINTVE